jgi:hypothetical protein
MEVEENKNEVRERHPKLTAAGLEKETSVAQDANQAHRYPHFDVDGEAWFFTDDVSDGAQLVGRCFRDTVTGRPMLLCYDPAQCYTLYIQVRADTPHGSGPMGFLVPVTEQVGSQMQNYLIETLENYRELGALQPNAYEVVDEAEQARFLKQLTQGIALKRVENELRQQLPQQLPQQAPQAGRRQIKGKRQLRPRGNG